MRSLSGYLLLYALALLLVSTSPSGTGQGAHHDQILDWVFPHVHVIDGQRIEPGRTPPLATPTPTGPSIGAGAGAESAAAGLALVPVLPKVASLPLGARQWRRPVPTDSILPQGRADPPPDPPPTSDSE